VNSSRSIALPHQRSNRSRRLAAWIAAACCLAGQTAAAQAVDDDASEIAARAVASALEGSDGGTLDELSAESYDAIARDLAARIGTIGREHGNVRREVIAPMTELANLHISANQCESAIPLLEDVLRLIRQLDGVLNAAQLPIFESLLECFAARERLQDLKRAQDQVLLIRENAYGRNDERMIPALVHAGEWYEEAGDYESARDAHSRAMSIARKLGGEQDIRLIEPLRGLARTLRLQMQFESEPWRGRALDDQAQRMLERAARIARASSSIDSKLKVDTLLELGDSYQIAGAARDAARIYREVWNAGGRAMLSEPEPVFYHAAVGTALRRAPLVRDKLKHYWIDFEFTVTRDGRVEDVEVRDASAPKHLQSDIAENIRRTPFRPRFADGEPVDTNGVSIRQGLWVEQ
jgi:tetratricopeptide (TPR) repeat protein